MKKILITIFLFISVLSLGQGRFPITYAQPAASGPADFPSIVGSYSRYDLTTSGTNHPIIITPTGITVGNLIMVVLVTSNSSTWTVNEGVSGASWNIEDQGVNGADVSGVVVWKIFEEGDTLALTSSNGSRGAFFSYNISGHNVSNPLTVTHAVANSTNANPPSNTPEYGSKNYLWMVYAGMGSYILASVAPADFSGLATQLAYTSGVSSSVATREYNTDSAYDPGTFTSNYSSWLCFTIIINPEY